MARPVWTDRWYSSNRNRGRARIECCRIGDHGDHRRGSWLSAKSTLVLDGSLLSRPHQLEPAAHNIAKRPTDKLGGKLSDGDDYDCNTRARRRSGKAARSGMQSATVPGSGTRWSRRVAKLLKPFTRIGEVSCH